MKPARVRRMAFFETSSLGASRRVLVNSVLCRMVKPFYRKPAQKQSASLLLIIYNDTDMIKLTWEDIERTTDELVEKIKAVGFKPDYIIGLATGGLIPLYFLASKLENNRNILTISVNSYEKDKKGDLKISYLPKIDLSNKKILLVDDIAGTGDTLKEISNVLVNKYKVRKLKTVTIVALKDSKFYPDWYGIEKHEDWIVFPWDKAEFPEYFKN